MPITAHWAHPAHLDWGGKGVGKTRRNFTV